MSIQIVDLVVTQEGLRDFSKFLSMIDRLIDGESLTPIKVSRIRGRLFIHDGHHRVCAYWCHGIRVLEDNQYMLKDYDLEDYTFVNYHKGWLTPFDPFQQVRITDLGDVKQRIDKYLLEQTKQDANQISNMNGGPINVYSPHYSELEQFAYTAERSIWTVNELCQTELTKA